MCVNSCTASNFFQISIPSTLSVKLCSIRGPVILPKYPQQCQMVYPLLLLWKQALTLLHTEFQCWANAGMTHVNVVINFRMDKHICSKQIHSDSFESAWLALEIHTGKLPVCISNTVIVKFFHFSLFMHFKSLALSIEGCDKNTSPMLCL